MCLIKKKKILQLIRSELEIIEASLKTCSDHLNDALDILPISDGKSEIEALGALATECKKLKEQVHVPECTVDDEQIINTFKHIESALERPKDLLLDHIKTLKVCYNKYCNLLFV